MKCFLKWMNAACLLGLICFLSGCGVNMEDQPRFETYEASDFFDDTRSARPLLPGTVAREQVELDEVLESGLKDGAFIRDFPLPLSRALITRGRERYMIYCSVCHDGVGNGEGMVPLRGFSKPPSFHSDRLRQESVGYLYDIITHGIGSMPSYKAQIKILDRWAIVAYLRVLQKSQDVRISDVPEKEREDLEEK
ncbi:MAG: cytochrome c [Chlamydiota bacterium]|nr:cytochrome c [Chlamydiota bacterium]